MQFGAKHYEAAAQYLVEEAEKIQDLAADRDDMVAEVNALFRCLSVPNGPLLVNSLLVDGML